MGTHLEAAGLGVWGPTRSVRFGSRKEETMQQRTMKLAGVALVLMALAVSSSWSQINTGSDGSDGVFNPSTNTIIDMTSHPNGIYQYASVNVPSGVSVRFTPNVNNTPVVWLVQSNVTINGAVSVSGLPALQGAVVGGAGGPGGYRGGSYSSPVGQGPGGGNAGTSNQVYGGNGSYGFAGFYMGPMSMMQPPGPIYGNGYLIPFLGGSGGGASYSTGCGGGGGGAILIAAGGGIQINGYVVATGGVGSWYSFAGGDGSGGSIRFVAPSITGTGMVVVAATNIVFGGVYGGSGRARFDTYLNNFGGQIVGVFTQGSLANKAESMYILESK